MSNKDYIINKIENESCITNYGKRPTPEVDFKKDIIKEPIYKIDPRTDFGKGITYKSVDGQEYESIEAVKLANKAYWDNMMSDIRGRKR